MRSGLWPLAAVSCSIALAGAASPARAQAWIGQMAAENGRAVQEDRCMRGRTTPSEREMAEVRGPAQALMAAYWRLASAEGNPDLSAAFRGSGDIGWNGGDGLRDRLRMAGASDALARDPALVLAAAPLSLARAGTDPSERADGIWAAHARGDPAAVAGYYRVEFRRDIGGRWGLVRLQLVNGPEPLAPLTPYCREPGDVEGYRQALVQYEAQRRAERERNNERRRARLARERAARARPVR